MHLSLTCQGYGSNPDWKISAWRMGLENGQWHDVYLLLYKNILHSAYALLVQCAAVCCGLKRDDSQRENLKDPLQKYDDILNILSLQVC